MKKLFAISLCILFTTSCISRSKYPDWYLNPPQNNSQFLYGAGEGFDKDEANYAALSDAASRLRISVASKTESAFDSDSLGASSSFAKKIKAESAKINFSNYSIEKNVQNSGTKSYLSLVKIDAQKFINSYKAEIVKNLQDIARYSSVSGGLLAKRQGLLKAAESALLVENKSSIIKTIDDSYVSSSNFVTSNILDSLKDVNSRLAIAIESNDYFLKSEIQEALSQEEISVKYPSNAKIVISANWTQSDIVGGKFVKLMSTISAIDSDGKQIFSKNVTSTGSSVVNFELAKKSAATNLQKQIKSSSGLLNFLSQK